MVLAMQVQGHCQAIRLSGGRVSMQLVGGAQHSFDRRLRHRERCRRVGLPRRADGLYRQ